MSFCEELFVRAGWDRGLWRHAPTGGIAQPRFLFVTEGFSREVEERSGEESGLLRDGEMIY